MTLKRTLIESIAIYANRRMALMLVLGFASGMPLALCSTTLTAWMVTEGIDIRTIGLYSLVGLPQDLRNRNMPSQPCAPTHGP